MNADAQPRTIKDGPFCWATKDALRTIHDGFAETSNLPSANSVYLALCMVASDQQSESFQMNKALIAFKAGVCVRTASTILTRFEQMHLLSIERRGIAGTKMKAASRYTLLSVGTNSTPIGNGCPSIGNSVLHVSVAEKVEESEKNLVEEEKKESRPSGFGGFSNGKSRGNQQPKRKPLPDNCKL